MFLYRVVSKDTFLSRGTNDSFTGINTFKYEDGEEYMHFFIIPELANVYQLLKYDNENEESIVLKCDLPYSLIKDNFGAGIYKYFNLRKRDPFIEVRIKKADFDKSMIVEMSDKVKEEWKNKAIYSRYMSRIIKGNDECVVEYNDDFSTYGAEKYDHPSLNSNFNFLNYFPLKELEKEGLKNDYDNDDIEYSLEDTIISNNKEVKPNKSFIEKLKSIFTKKRIR